MVPKYIVPVILASVLPSRGPQCLFGKRNMGLDADLFLTGAQDMTFRNWAL